jgi:hypothetical protein
MRAEIIPVDKNEQYLTQTHALEGFLPYCSVGPTSAASVREYAAQVEWTQKIKAGERGFRVCTIGDQNVILLEPACWISIFSAALKQHERGLRKDRLQHEAAVSVLLSRHCRDKGITLLGVSQMAAVEDFGANLRSEER